MRVDSATFAQKNLELAKDPRYVIELAFDLANTQLWYFTSHADAALPPAGVSGSILGIVEGLSGTSQTLNQDTANASIGNINFRLVDRASIVTTTLGGQLVLGRSTRKQRVRVYVGYPGLAWADYTLVQTQLVTEIAFADGAYKFTCADIQREMRKDLFDLAKTTLALSLDDVATTVEVYTTTGFSTVAHGTSYSDAPSATVGYIKIEDEVIRYTGKTSTQFTGCVRGALNTRAVAHNVDATAAADRHEAVIEYVYLELPAIDLMYRLLTGKDRLGASVMPSTWNLGIATSYVRLADFTGIGKDLWDTADDLQGFPVRLEDLGKTDGKKFIETELALLDGVFMPIYADGAAGCKRMANILSGAAYVRLLDERNIVSYGDLTHDFSALHNVIQIGWNWEPLQKDFTRVNALLDAASIATHGRADPLNLKFRGLHGSRHSSAIIAQRFDALRDRFTGPPLRLEVSVVPSLNTLEVGDVVRVRLANVRDFTAPGGGGPLDRSFEIQNIQIDWITGALKLKLFASSQAPGAVAPTSDATVLTPGWYTGTGTALTSALTITGSNPGHVSASGSLAGNADMNAAGAIYYYDGDLQIDAGVVVTIANNVQLRVKGFLQNNGAINGRGNGLPAGGSVGFIGITEAGGGIDVRPVTAIRGAQVVGRNSSVPIFNLAWDGTALAGLPGDLRGTSGATGATTFYDNPNGKSIAGGVGGSGGAGLEIICRGFAQGANGKIDLSGAAGSASAGGITFGDIGAVYKAGSGAGGAPGALLIILDGAGTTATGLTDTGFIALYGVTPITGTPMSAPTIIRPPNSVENTIYSYYAGTGDGTTFPLPSLSDSRGGSRVQYVPGNPLATVDPNAPDLALLLQELQSANWTVQDNPKSLDLQDIAWGGTQFVAVGNADTDAYILTSPDGVIQTERTNPKAFALLGIAWNGSIFCAVGNADGTDSYLITSPDGITWTERANPQNWNLRDVVWTGSQFVAVGDSNAAAHVGYIITSPDGTTWTQRTTGVPSVDFNGVTWSPELQLIAAVGGRFLTSPDGITWTNRGTPSAVLQSVAWHVSPITRIGKFVAGGGAVSLMYSSADGITWATISGLPANDVYDDVIGTPLIAVAVGGVAGTRATVSTTRDATNWVSRQVQTAAKIKGIAWSGRRFVGVGETNGTRALVLASLAN